jgi:hypothetical protein
MCLSLIVQAVIFRSDVLHVRHLAGGSWYTWRCARAKRLPRVVKACKQIEAATHLSEERGSCKKLTAMPPFDGELAVSCLLVIRRHLHHLHYQINCVDEC